MFTSRRGFLSALVVKFPMEMKQMINKNYQNFLKYWEIYTTLLNELRPEIFKNKST